MYILLCLFLSSLCGIQAHLVGLDVFTGRKYEDIYPVAHKVEVPVVIKTEYQVSYRLYCVL